MTCFVRLAPATCFPALGTGYVLRVSAIMLLVTRFWLDLWLVSPEVINRLYYFNDSLKNRSKTDLLEIVKTISLFEEISMIFEKISPSHLTILRLYSPIQTQARVLSEHWYVIFKWRNSVSFFVTDSLYHGLCLKWRKCATCKFPRIIWRISAKLRKRSGIGNRQPNTSLRPGFIP